MRHARTTRPAATLVGSIVLAVGAAACGEAPTTLTKVLSPSDDQARPKCERAVPEGSTVACGASSEPMVPDAALVQETVSAASVDVERPFRATWEPAGHPSPPVSPPPAGRCAEGAIAFQGHKFQGEGTHLGRFTMEASWCNYLTHYEGVATIVAANGDELRFDFENGRILYIDPPIIVYRDDFTFTGGTGRFASASGGGYEDNHFNTTVGLGKGTMTGTIHYDASDRAGRP